MAPASRCDDRAANAAALSCAFNARRRGDEVGASNTCSECSAAGEADRCDSMAGTSWSEYWAAGAADRCDARAANAAALSCAFNARRRGDEVGAFDTWSENWTGAASAETMCSDDMEANAAALSSALSTGRRGEGVGKLDSTRLDMGANEAETVEAGGCALNLREELFLARCC